jgi:hypothetical protein
MTTPQPCPYLAATQRWVERAVIGLNLCPFAKAVQVKAQVRYVRSDARHIDALIEDLIRELEHLAEVTPATTDTTVLVHPHVLQDFLDYNDFLDIADAVLEELELDGILQIASFHPQYQFDGTAADDISNATNRSPYPTLHLLREDSIARAVAAFPDPASIYTTNQATLAKLGAEGWAALDVGPTPDAAT